MQQDSLWLWELPAQTFLHDLELILPLQSLHHRHFARKSLLHRSYLPSIGQTSTLGSSANRDTNCLIIYLPLFSIAFWFLMSSSGERLHQNLKSYPLVTLASDGTICVILKKCASSIFFFWLAKARNSNPRLLVHSNVAGLPFFITHTFPSTRTAPVQPVGKLNRSTRINQVFYTAVTKKGNLEVCNNTQYLSLLNTGKEQGSSNWHFKATCTANARAATLMPWKLCTLQKHSQRKKKIWILK